MLTRARKTRADPVAESPPSPAPEVVRFPGYKTHCPDCHARPHCLPHTLCSAEIARFGDLIGNPRRLKKDQVLYLAGGTFSALYAIRHGAVRTTIVAENGREQIAGYHILGEIIGTDGIATGHHICSAVTVMDSEVCGVPFDRLEVLAREIPALQRSLNRLLLREIGSNHERMLMLGSMNAQERLACFLLDLSERRRRGGLSPCEITLHMSREQIGSHLGLKLETVSRALSRLQAAGMLQVQGREIKLLDPPALRRLLGRDDRAPPQ